MPKEKPLSLPAFLIFLAFLACPSPGQSQGTLADKLSAAGKSLRTVQALNHASQYEARVAPGETCLVYSGSVLRQIADLSDGKVELLYKPTLVFLSTGERDRGRLMNVWSDFLTPGRPMGFCPKGTRFVADEKEVRHWDETREQLVLYPRPDEGSPLGVSWVVYAAAE